MTWRAIYAWTHHETAKTAARRLAQVREREYAALKVVERAKRALEATVLWYDENFDGGGQG